MTTKNVVILVIVVGLDCFIAGYLFKDTKTITTTIHSQEDIDKISSLEKQLQEKTQTHTVTVSSGGTTTTTTDTTIDRKVDTHKDTTVSDNIITNSKTITEINPKNYLIGASYDTKNNIGIEFVFPIFWIFNGKIEPRYNRINQEISGNIGILIKF